MLIVCNWKECIILIYLWKTKSTRLTYLMSFYKTIRHPYVQLMGISNMKTAKFDVFCIQKMKLMETKVMKTMEAYLICENKHFQRVCALRCLLLCMFA